MAEEVNYQQPTVNIWFPTQTEPPYVPEDEEATAEFNAYWAREDDRCKAGFYIDKVYVSGWLYFHTVYWKIARYIDMQMGPVKRKVRQISTPMLRSIEWMIAEDFNVCERDGLFYMLVGCRGFGKSIIAASRAAWLYTFFDQSEALITGAEGNYIKLTTDKVEDGLTNLHPIYKKQRIANNWDEEIKAGWKDKSTNQPDPRSSNSLITIRNYKNGNNSMAANGTRPGFHLIDEIGTLRNFIGCITDSIPAWWAAGRGDNARPTCLAMFAGTGGDMEVGDEAAEVFYDPHSYNIYGLPDIYEGGNDIGRFVSATAANMDFFYEITLNVYLGVQSETLRGIKIKIPDETKAMEWWNKEHEIARKSGNQKTYLKFLAYNPITPKHSFLKINKNDFNTEAAAKQQAALKTLGMVGTPVEFYHDGYNIKHNISDKLPITQFPVKDGTTDAPVMIYEFPIEKIPPFGLYVAGVDPYRHGKSATSKSLGAVYIFKRIHNIIGEKFQYQFVASYVARPNDKGDWEQQARFLIKYYNALALVENDEYSFIDYMVKMGDEMYLQAQPDWLKGIAPKHKVDRKFGIHMSNPAIRSHVFDQLKKHLDAPLSRTKDIKGNVIEEILGVTTVMDPMLLEEIVKFNFDDNFDRVIAAAIAVTLANHLDPLYKISDTKKDERFESYFKRNATRTSMVGSRSTARRMPNGQSTLFAGRR